MRVFKEIVNGKYKFLDKDLNFLTDQSGAHYEFDDLIKADQFQKGAQAKLTAEFNYLQGTAAFKQGYDAV